MGSAIHAAVAAGAYPDVHAAAAAMGSVQRAVYTPDEGRARAYDALFAEYTTLHDYFGRGGNDVMHRLRADPHGRRWPDDRRVSTGRDDRVAAARRWPRCTRS